MAFHGRFYAPCTPAQENISLTGEKLRHVERAGASGAGAFHDVEVNHGGGDVSMAEKVLNGPDVDAAFEEVGCEAVAKGVAGGGFVKAGLARGLLELALHRSIMKMVSGNPAGSRVRTKCCGGEEKLPWPFAGGVGVFSHEGFGQVGVTASAREVCGVFLAFFGEVVFQPGFQGAGGGRLCASRPFRR